MKIGWYYTVGVWMIIVFSLGSCQEEQVVEVKSEEFSLPVTLEVDGYAHMDSAQFSFSENFRIGIVWCFVRWFTIWVCNPDKLILLCLWGFMMFLF